MANQYKQQRQGRQQAGERKGPSHQELSNLYGDNIFSPLETVVKDVIKRGVAIEDGNIIHIKEVAGEEFAGELQTLRQVIFEVPQEHKGAVDGWMKQTINDSFTKEEADIAFFLVMPSQAKKHRLIAEIAEFVGSNTSRKIKVFAETKMFVNGLLGEAADLVQKLSADTNAAGPEPKREDYPQMGFGEFLAKIKEPWRAAQTEARSGLGEIKGKISWLRNWVEGKPRPGKPGSDAHEKPKSEIEAKRQEIARLERELGEATQRRNQGVASDNDAMIMEATGTRTKLVAELETAKVELVTLEQAEALKARVEAVAQVVASAPEMATGTFQVGTDADAAKAKQALAGGKPAVDLQAEIVRLETEVTNQLAAVERHETETARLSQEGRKVEDDLAAAQMLNAARLERGKAVSARAFAAKAGTELAELKFKAKPVATAITAPSVAAATATQDTGTVDDPIKFLEAYLEEVENDDLTKVTAGLLEAVKLAVGEGKGAKRIARAVARLQSEEINVEAVIADTEAILAIAK